jgi:1-aminocyclopropane-1-carboxylate deaminase/D-cysteine desulfhydrase-like pyridoxal-dependent ACC family enzyme
MKSDKQEIIKDLQLDIITPIELIDGLYFKREDKFKPFDNIGVNGTKLRQCAYLLIKNLDKAKNGVLTCCSIHSPQGIIVTALCNYLGIKSTVFYGATTEERLKLLHIPKLINSLNGNIEIVSKIGRLTVLNSKAKKRQIETNEFIIEHGMDLMNNIDCFLESVANQVQNLPDNLDNLVITCGSAISTTGILYGLKLYNKKVKNIILVGVAPNRIEKINKNLKELQDKLNIELVNVKFKYIDLFNTKGFKYEKQEFAEHCGVKFHPNYEAKTYNWLKNNIDYKNEKSCLWIIGGEI